MPMSLPPRPRRPAAGPPLRRTARRAGRRGFGLASAAATLLVLSVVSVAPAHAASGRIDRIEGGDPGRLSVVFGASGLPGGTTIDPATVTVTVGGEQVRASAGRFGDPTAAVRRSAMLVIDTSGSMQGAGLAGAKRAAEAFLSNVPPDVAVGLVTFAQTARVASAPTTDRASVRDAVAALTAGRRTALYDGVVLAAAALGTDGSRGIVLLSDGNDTASKATLAQASDAVSSANVRLDAVSLGRAQQQRSSALTSLTAAGDGRVVPVAAPGRLTAAFRSAAAAIASQVLVTADVPPAMAGTSRTVVVSAKAGGEPITDQVAALLPTSSTASPGTAPHYGPVPVTTASSITSAPWFLPAAVGAVSIGLLVLLLVAFLGPRRDSESGRIGRRLGRYSLAARDTGSVSSSAPATPASGQVARSAMQLADRVVQKRDLDNSLGTRLDAAGVPLRPAEWMLIHIGAPIALGLALMLLTDFSVLAALLGVVIGVVVPFGYLSIKETRRKAAFSAQLADTLQLLAGSLSAGYSLPQAVDVVVREAAPPMSAELNRALVETRLGVPLEDALEAVATRMNNVDLSWVVMAIKIQREVGGNLAEVLTNVAATLRERERLRRQVQVLSAEGRLSAGILFGLPLVFIVYLMLVRPEYIAQLITDPLGIVMAVVGAALLVAGGFWLRKVVRVEV